MYKEHPQVGSYQRPFSDSNIRATAEDRYAAVSIAGKGHESADSRVALWRGQGCPRQ